MPPRPWYNGSLASTYCAFRSGRTSPPRKEPCWWISNTGSGPPTAFSTWFISFISTAERAEHGNPAIGSAHRRRCRGRGRVPGQERVSAGCLAGISKSGGPGLQADRGFRKDDGDSHRAPQPGAREELPGFSGNGGSGSVAGSPRIGARDLSAFGQGPGG